MPRNRDESPVLLLPPPNLHFDGPDEISLIRTYVGRTPPPRSRSRPRSRPQSPIPPSRSAQPRVDSYTHSSRDSSSNRRSNRRRGLQQPRRSRPSFLQESPASPNYVSLNAGSTPTRDYESVSTTPISPIRSSTPRRPSRPPTPARASRSPGIIEIHSPMDIDYNYGLFSPYVGDSFFERPPRRRSLPLRADANTFEIESPASPTQSPSFTPIPSPGGLFRAFDLIDYVDSPASPDPESPESPTLEEVFGNSMVRLSPISMPTLYPATANFNQPSTSSPAQIRSTSTRKRKHSNTSEKSSLDSEILHELQVKDLKRKLAQSERQNADLRHENEELKKEITCIICLTEKRDTIFFPCSHLHSCNSCANRQQECAVCRQDIRGKFRIFL